jgi:hypothetical protein
MAKNSPRTFDGSSFSVWHVIDSANAYYELSTVFTSQVPETLAEMAKTIVRNDLAAASATNRFLALELYLKALLMAASVRVPEVHNFVTLFAAIPAQNQKEIRAEYDKRISVIPGTGTAWGLEILFGVGTTPLNDAEIDKQIPRVQFDNSLPELLLRNKDGFVESRYLFAAAKPGKISCFYYEHRTLAVLCGVLCEGLEHSLPGRQPGYKRHFRF